MAHRISVQTLTLSHFRNYPSLMVETEGKSMVITGANGAGKTNLLEAISLLAAGRGLRGAKLSQFQYQPISHDNGWGVAAEIITGSQSVSFGTGQQQGKKDKRIIRIDGETMRGQSCLAEHFAVLWQTPQMDGLFSQGQSERRMYFDRICSAFTPEHSSLIAKFDYLRRERAKLLSAMRNDTQWLNSLELKMAETSMAIAASRIELLNALNHALAELNHIFPKAILSFNSTIEAELLAEETPAIQVEERIISQLAQSRAADAVTGRASFGAHKMELEVIFAPKGVEAAYCSTGEQKALMLSLLLAQAQSIRQRQKRLPILLLDEVVAHLDNNRRAALFETLDDLNCQCWMTGTDTTLFSQLKNVQFATAQEGKLSLNATAN